MKIIDVIREILSTKNRRDLFSQRFSRRMEREGIQSYYESRSKE